MSAKVFLDTNILVYAHDNVVPNKREIAACLVTRLWREGSGVLSVQVLQELYVALTKRAAIAMDPEEVENILQDYLTWKIVINDATAVMDAIQIQRRYHISFWDALIVKAANQSGAKILYSEDLNHEQVYGEVKVLNPFRAVQS